MNAPNKQIFDQLEASRHRDDQMNQHASQIEHEEPIDEDPAEDPLDTVGASGHVKIADNNNNTFGEGEVEVNNSDMIDEVNDPKVFHNTMGAQGFNSG